jgi:hypothetical protein
MNNRARLMARMRERIASGFPSPAGTQPFNFDELAKDVAQGLSRRQALKLAFTGLASTALASLGGRTALAMADSCTPVQVVAPSTDNVCTSSPWQGFDGVDFQCCCVQHDYCFTTCGSSFSACNASFFNCLVNQCRQLRGTQRLQCTTVAFLMYQGVSTSYPDTPVLPRSGFSRFVEDQSTNCACTCPDGQTVCSSGSMCSQDSTCVNCDTCVTSVPFCPAGG